MDESRKAPAAIRAEWAVRHEQLRRVCVARLREQMKLGKGVNKTGPLIGIPDLGSKLTKGHLRLVDYMLAAAANGAVFIDVWECLEEAGISRTDLDLKVDDGGDDI